MLAQSESKQYLVGVASAGAEAEVAAEPGASCALMLCYVLVQAVTLLLLVASGLKSLAQYTPIQVNSHFL